MCQRGQDHWNVQTDTSHSPGPVADISVRYLSPCFHPYDLLKKHFCLGKLLCLYSFIKCKTSSWNQSCSFCYLHGHLLSFSAQYNCWLLEGTANINQLNPVYCSDFWLELFPASHIVVLFWGVHNRDENRLNLFFLSLSEDLQTLHF